LPNFLWLAAGGFLFMQSAKWSNVKKSLQKLVIFVPKAREWLFI
jgi:hypothetical protein